MESCEAIGETADKVHAGSEVDGEAAILSQQYQVALGSGVQHHLELWL